MPQQFLSNHPDKFVLSLDAQPLSLEVIDEEGLPHKDYKLFFIYDEHSHWIVDIRVKPSSLIEDPSSPQ